LDWCTALLGPCQVVSGSERPDARSGTSRLRTRDGYAYLKVHQDPAMWAREVHGYESWAPVFGRHAPPLLGVREEPPLALLIGALEGQVLENVALAAEQERVAWRTAGEWLARLHALPDDGFFGPCARDGSPPPGAMRDPVAYLTAEFAREMEHAAREDLLDARKQAVVRAALKRVELFSRERPVACHRDYNPYNWVVGPNGTWAGVIDFEFAHWDVRVREFSRYPDWEWIERPDLVEALLEGYGRPLTPREQEQCLVARTLYALSAITWGTGAAYHGFVAEGRRALEHLAGSLGAT
jgi:Ser/Thr protein kinase RdoA (MazF antagonist)